jgi:hypothetical protein
MAIENAEVESAWPPAFFDCFGAWQGDQLERPTQGDYEQREGFD